MRKCKITIFPSNKLEILLRFSASAFYYALSCVKGFCICWREKSPLLEQLLSVSICIKHQVKYKVKMKLNMFTSNSIRKAISSTEYSCLIYHKKKKLFLGSQKLHYCRLKVESSAATTVCGTTGTIFYCTLWNLWHSITKLH